MSNGIKKFTCRLVLAAVAAISLCILAPALQAEQAIQVGTHNQVFVPGSTSLPIIATSGFFEQSSGRAVVYVALSPAVSGPAVHSATVLLVHIRGSKVLGGQGFTVAIQQSSQANGEQFTPFFSMQPGDSIGAIVTGVTTANGNQNLPPSEIGSLTKALVQIEQAKFDSGGLRFEPSLRGHILATDFHPASRTAPSFMLNFSPAVQPEHATCASDELGAENVCGTAGIHSFSCNPQTGSFSFTCNGS